MPAKRHWPAVLLLAALPLSAPAETVPQYGDKAHLGVSTCAASTCHGAVKPWQNSTVLQNEFLTWQQHDRHAKSYETLKSDRSRRIAANLGIGPAHKADLCLDCHADNVPEAKRAKNFRIEDGVGCEACHGGAMDWLGVHQAGMGTHADNIAAGMYPTDEPIARARLCLSCHFGDENKFLTHRIMGAGHPRVSFELDTFTVSQPAHFSPDEDYRKRKDYANGIKTWAVGQAVAAGETMAALLDGNRNRAGIFPELVFFDCLACHHSMSSLRWQRRESTGLEPGTPRLNDSNLVMLRVIAGVVDPAAGRAVRKATRDLHQASQQGTAQTAAAARRLRDQAEALAVRFAGHAFSPDSILAALRGLIAEGRAGDYSSYVAAEQAVMAMATLLDNAGRSGAVRAGALDRAGAALEQAYKATENDETYQPARLLTALENLDAALP